MQSYLHFPVFIVDIDIMMIGVFFLMILILYIVDAMPTKSKERVSLPFDLNHSPPPSPGLENEMPIVQHEEGSKIESKLIVKRKRDRSKPVQRKYNRYTFPPGTTLKEKRKVWNQAFIDSQVSRNHIFHSQSVLTQ